MASGGCGFTFPYGVFGDERTTEQQMADAGVSIDLSPYRTPKFTKTLYYTPSAGRDNTSENVSLPKPYPQSYG